MVAVQTEQLNIKLQPELYRELDLVAKLLHIPKNEWARGILAQEVKKKLAEHRLALVREYWKGAVTRKELVAVLGEPEVKSIETIAKVGKASFEDAARLAKARK